MPRTTKPIVLNEVQTFNLGELQKVAVDGVISAEKLNGFKSNVINGLVNRKVLKAIRGNAMKLTGVAVQEAA